MPSPSLLQRLKERKLVQWGLAYLAGAWVLFEVSDAVGGRLGWPDVFYRGQLVILALGFFVTLVLAWFHGEKGHQRVSGPELLMVAALLVVAGVALSSLSGRVQPPTDAEFQPLVIMMDSPHPVRVYDEEILEAAGANADAVSDILADLPIRRQKEAIGPDWHHDEDIAGFDPDLIVIHASGFLGGDTISANYDRRKLFISYLADRDAKFLVYSRLGGLPEGEDKEEFLQQWVKELLRGLEPKYPGLLIDARLI